MDGNKDEALKCLRIGKEALNSGDRSRAVKFLSKARRLDPSLPVDDLLYAAARGGEGESRKASSTTDGGPTDVACDQPEMSTAPPSSSTPKLRNRTRFSSAAEGSSSLSRNYTEEQITLVRQITKQKDYYQILGLERSCSIEDVRKAYRKLSLKVHPDKNNAPGSEDAFKAVSKAFQCLSNEENRKKYDISGTDEPSPHRAATRHQSHGFNSFYDAEDFDPDEIFRSFFFGGMPPTATAFGPFHFRAGGMQGQNGHGTNGTGGFNLRTLIQILPILILLLVNFLPSSSPIYVLSRQYPYEHKVETPRGVPYFVKSPKFEEEYPYKSAERITLERHIERDFFAALTQNCRAELQRRHWGFTDQTPHCDMLRKFEETAA